ncbi:hypothetical protein AAHC03_019473 [Spirometra sp. Aus1]
MEYETRFRKQALPMVKLFPQLQQATRGSSRTQHLHRHASMLRQLPLHPRARAGELGEYASVADCGVQRKMRKPAMEKRRRERINVALEELKRLVAEPFLKENAQKLEKADILDLTVKFVLDCITRSKKLTNQSANWTQNAQWISFMAGYTACESVLRDLFETQRQLADDCLRRALPTDLLPLLLCLLDKQRQPAAASFLRSLEPSLCPPAHPQRLPDHESSTCMMLANQCRRFDSVSSSTAAPSASTVAVETPQSPEINHPLQTATTTSPHSSSSERLALNEERTPQPSVDKGISPRKRSLWRPW